MKLLHFNILFGILFSTAIFAQETDFVKQDEFKNKTQTLNAQVKNIRASNTEIYKEVSGLKSSYDQLKLELNQVRNTSINNSLGLENTDKVHQAIENKLTANNNHCNMLTVLFVGLFIVSLLLIFTVNKRSVKTVKELKAQLEETNSMLIEQGKLHDNKIAKLTVDLETRKEELEKLKDQLNK